MCLHVVFLVACCLLLFFVGKGGTAVGWKNPRVRRSSTNCVTERWIDASSITDEVQSSTVANSTNTGNIEYESTLSMIKF